MSQPSPARLPILDLTTWLGRLSLFVLMIGLFSLYVPINWPWGEVHNLATSLDKHIPLIPAFVIPYVFIFFGWGAGLLIWTGWRRPRVFVKLIISLLAGTIISYIIYLSFQTTVPRPEITADNFFTQILKWIYSSDRRYNAFPSGHTFTTTILFLTTWPLVRVWGRLIVLLAAVSIILATLFLKQHYLPDVAGGLALGALAVWLSGKIAPFFMDRATETTFPQAGLDRNF